MKIHGTAKGGALSTKDFGVAFGGAAEGFIVATGGTVDEDDDYKIHKFTSSGNFEIESAPDSATVEYLIVAGGAGGSEAVLALEQ